MQLTIRLDNFDGLDSKKYVALNLDGNSIVGGWSVVADTSVGFPKSGSYTLSVGATDLKDANGAAVCQLVGFAPGQVPESGTEGDVGISYEKLPSAFATWHYQN